MNGWTLGLLEVAPVAIVAVIVFRHLRAARDDGALEPGADSPLALPRADSPPRWE